MTPPTSVDLWFDPACPYAWTASQWIVQVQQQRSLDVRFHVMSLAMLREGREGRAHEGSQYPLGPARVCAAVEQVVGNAAMCELYTALGRRRHIAGRRLHHDVVTEALREVELDTAFADNADTADYDDVLRSSSAAAVGTPGGRIGTPTLHVDGAVMFGPALTQVPRGDLAVRIWDATLTLTQYSPFFELTRHRSDAAPFDGRI